MIFVTVGTHDQGFERLVKKMDEIAGQIDEEVVIQVGSTDYEPLNAKWFKFVDIEEIKDLYKKARVIIAHAGAGTLLDCFEYGKTLIVVPRLKRYGEHIDDQQLELAEALEQSKRAMAVYDIGKLGNFIFESYSKTSKEFNNAKNLKKYLKILLNSNNQNFKRII